MVNDKRKTPITERKDSAPVYSTKPTITDFSHKMTRSSTSDGVLRNVTKAPTSPIKDDSKASTTTSSLKADSRRPAKFIATKTVNLSASNQTIRSENLEDVFIDIQQAKSSREPSPDRIVPTPVSPDEDTGCPRFPDTVVEPDENQHFAARSHHFEQLSRRDRCVITEVEADRIYESEPRVEQLPAERSDHTDQSLRHDVCLLSVQDKVRKVISATEEHVRPNRPSKPLAETLDSNVSGKINQFISIAENIRKSTVPESLFQPKQHQKPHQSPKEHTAQPIPTAPELSDTETRLPSSDDQCLLSVSDKINRFTAAAALEQMSVLPPQKSPTLVARMERKISRIQENTDDESSYHREETDNHYQRSTSSSSNDRYRTDKQYALRQLSQEKSVERSLENRRRMSREDSLEAVGSSNSSRRGSQEPTSTNNVRRKSKEDSPSSGAEELGCQKVIPAQRRGSDEMRRVKSIFENRENGSDSWEQRRADIKGRDIKLTGKINQTTLYLVFSQHIYQFTDIGIYKRNTSVSSNEKANNEPEVSNHFSNGDSLRSKRDEHLTIKKDLSKNGIAKIQTHSTNGDVDSSNVELSSNTSRASVARKATTPQVDTTSPIDAGRVPSYMSHTVCSLEHIRRNSSDVVDGHRPRKSSLQHQNEQDNSDQPNGRRDESIRSSSGRRISCSADTVFEDIFDLEQLEQMLEIVVGYEQRRRIRAQIRLVKRQNTNDNQDKSKSISTVKTSRIETNNMLNQVKPTVTAQAKTTHTIRKEEVTAAQKQAAFIEHPQLDPTIVRKLDSSRVQQQRSFEEVKPVWATQNILKKASDQPPTRKVTTSVKKVTTRTEPFKSVEEVDCVTSSYGIGPIDDYGKPLFGISALKRKTTTQQKSTGKYGFYNLHSLLIFFFKTFLQISNPLTMKLNPNTMRPLQPHHPTARRLPSSMAAKSSKAPRQTAKP